MGVRGGVERRLVGRGGIRALAQLLEPLVKHSLCQLAVIILLGHVHVADTGTALHNARLLVPHLRFRDLR